MLQQRGLSLIGLLMVSALIVVVALIGFKLLPAYIEYFAVKKVLAAMVHSGDTKGTVAEIKKAFDRRSLIDDIHSLKGEDLDVTKEGGTVVVSANYSVKVPLVANVSACIDFSTSTGE